MAMSADAGEGRWRASRRGHVVLLGRESPPGPGPGGRGGLWPGSPVVSSLGSSAFPAGFRSFENPDFRWRGGW